MSAEDLRRLTSVATEVEASLIVAALGDAGVEARAVGGFVSGFKAEAPGNVQVVVRRHDMERAAGILSSFREAETTTTGGPMGTEEEPSGRHHDPSTWGRGLRGRPVVFIVAVLLLVSPLLVAVARSLAQWLFPT